MKNIFRINCKEKDKLKSKEILKKLVFRKYYMLQKRNIHLNKKTKIFATNLHNFNLEILKGQFA